MAIPKALEPTGVVLVDKPAGPSSFQIVARVRSRTGAKTGHAGTLDPFATGLLVLLSGRATSLQDRFMKLDKRYLTEVDLRARTSTGDPEGDVVEAHEPPSRDELEAALEGLRGAVELPIPAASAVKIGGERAYRLHRQGVAVEMPTRVMRVHELALDSYAAGVARLELLVGSGTLRAVDRGRARRSLPHAPSDRDRPVRSRRGGRGARRAARGGAPEAGGGAMRIATPHLSSSASRAPSRSARSTGSTGAIAPCSGRRSTPASSRR